MAAITQVSPSGYGTRRYGSFTGRIASDPITMLGNSGYGVRRYASGAFTGRTETVAENVFNYPVYCRTRKRR